MTINEKLVALSMIGLPMEQSIPSSRKPDHYRVGGVVRITANSHKKTKRKLTRASRRKNRKK